ncbi:SdiA-regulated domain-containing protein [Rhodocyclus tenuis]|uniref:Uncharacterized protein YjiK n=1 Tax=Rhodocyclus tenuis TaxID=1066 RepID=A0A840GE17_RHOTE|nr:SdiA-regulated domain-containing protein [Rhodocyclus tenuis]MBB4249090.1 uncharacterized protein YjiK [Rhodocyclus tenuis]
MKLKALFLALAATGCVAAHAADSINLGNYRVSGTYSLDILNGTSGGISGLEGSAITYARDRGTLFYVGDEGTGVIEISRTGQTLGSMNFDWSGTGSSKHDTEGLTYQGNGVLVVSEERLQDAYRFTYQAGGSAKLASSSVSISNETVGNSGMEGISYDPRNGSFVTIKQESPQNVLSGTLSFAAGSAGKATMTSLFDPALLGLATLSDVQTLSPVDALAGTAAADNLLLLSLGSRMLVEVNRSGQILSSFDLTNVMPHNGIEGVTIDEKGTIYLVAEQVQDGASGLAAGSQLIVLSAPVPEPESYAMLLAGLGMLGFVARRRRQQAPA